MHFLQKCTGASNLNSFHSVLKKHCECIKIMFELDRDDYVACH